MLGIVKGLYLVTAANFDKPAKSREDLTAQDKLKCHDIEA